MKVGIMQPYFFPYIGYWQLIHGVDKFVVYDNIEFTKSGWVRRNRILLNGKDRIISIPIKKASDYLDIRDRYTSETFEREKVKILNQIKTAYNKAPQFNLVYPIIESAINCGEKNLFNFIYTTIIRVINYLEIETEIIVSSSIDMDHSLKNKDRVIEICKNLKGEQYINPIGGMKLYLFDDFKLSGINLKFLKANDIKYKQFDNEFVPNLSIIDVMMFNSKSMIKKMLNDFTLIE